MPSPAPQLQAPDPFTLLRAAGGGPLQAQLLTHSLPGSHNAPRQGLVQFLGWGAGSALAECPGQAPGLAGHPVTHRINMKTAAPPNLCPRHSMSRSESCMPRGRTPRRGSRHPPGAHNWILCLPGPPSFPSPDPQQPSMCQAMPPGWGSGERALLSQRLSLAPKSVDVIVDAGRWGCRWLWLFLLVRAQAGGSPYQAQMGFLFLGFP